ncbi:MAG: hypothetical protein HY070_05225 [Chloroflexi bacterium]|nr:hypothetical protein [Chloroflexota bacterium]
MNIQSDQLRTLPSVDALLQDHTLRDYAERFSHAIVADACRDAPNAARKNIRAGGDATTA